MKITGDCPHCKKEVQIDIEKLEVKQPKPAEMPNASTTGQQTQQIQKEATKEEKIIEKEVIRAPSDQPFIDCKDCKSLHKNPNYKHKPNKRCANDKCGQLNKEDSKGCKNCGSAEFEEELLSDDELNEIGIPEPEVEDHEPKLE